MVSALSFATAAVCICFVLGDDGHGIYKKFPPAAFTIGFGHDHGLKIAHGGLKVGVGFGSGGGGGGIGLGLLHRVGGGGGGGGYGHGGYGGGHGHGGGHGLTIGLLGHGIHLGHGGGYGGGYGGYGGGYGHGWW